MKTVLRIVRAWVGMLSAVAAIAFSYLGYIGTPSNSSVMKFEGFIELPKTKQLNILDYLTVRDNVLFVTEESAGNVFKLTLDPSTQVSATNISTLPGSGAVHGVLLLPSPGLAFVTRTEENTEDPFDPITLHSLAPIPVARDTSAILSD